jgi:hypothetical protein
MCAAERFRQPEVFAAGRRKNASVSRGGRRIDQVFFTSCLRALSGWRPLVQLMTATVAQEALWQIPVVLFSRIPNRNFQIGRTSLKRHSFEGDPNKLPERVQAAEAAIFLRWQALFQSLDGHVEVEAIRDAMRTLRAIKAEKMHYPDWNDK